MTKVEIIVDSAIPKNAIFIEGFQGIGLVGTLAAQYLSEIVKAKLIGYVDVSELPPIAILVNGHIQNPIRIHHFKKSGKNFIVFESELPIPQKFINSIARAIADFAKKNKAKEIISFEGLAVPQSPAESKTYWISNVEEDFENFKSHATALKSGIVVGVSAALLVQAKARNVPAAVIMAEAHPDYPDGLAAASLLRVMNKVYKLDVDVRALEKESKKFEAKIWSVIEKAQQIKDAGDNPGRNYIG
jgi:uncharacterized protein